MTDKRLYIANTPYHVILSAAMSNMDNKFEKIIFAPNESDLHSLRDAITTVGPFEEYESVNSIHSTNFIYKKCKIISNIQGFMQYRNENNINEIVIYNDQRPDIQAILEFCEAETVTYAEDGSAAYSTRRRSTNSIPPLWIKKLFYGYWYEDLSVLGTSKWVDSIRAVRPDLLRPELQSYPVKKISKSSILRVRSQEWFKNYISKLDIQPERMRDIDIIIVLSHPLFDGFNKRYLKLYGDILEEAQKQGLNTAVKYHPRDNKEHLSTKSYKGVEKLPSEIPFEALSLISNPPLIIGDISTSLYTASLLTESQIVSIYGVLDYKNEGMENIFSDFDIDIIDNLKELKALINRI